MSTVHVADWKSDLLRYYVSRHAVAVGHFDLVGGGTTDFYIDGRMVTTYPPALAVIAERMSAVIADQDLLGEDTNIVAPVLSGVPIAVALGMKLNRAVVFDRGAPKAHGRGRRFEGAFTDSPNCLMIDDLVTAGTTLRDSVEALRQGGRIVGDAVVTVDRQEGGVEALAAIGVNARVLITQDELRTAWEATNDAR